RFDGLALGDAQELGGLAKAGAGRGGGPVARIVRREEPAGGPAHGETAHDDAVLVDAVLALDAVERLEQVHLAGKLVGVAVAAVALEDKGVGADEGAAAPLHAVDEVHLA